jgi:hypothetical protein
MEGSGAVIEIYREWFDGNGDGDGDDGEVFGERRG